MAETGANRYKSALANAAEDWVNGDYRVGLVSGAVTIDADHSSVADFLGVNTELSDASYGRVALGSKTNTQDDTNDRANLDAATADFTSLDNETPTAMFLYRHVDGTDANDLLVGVFDTNFGDPANGAGYTVEFPNDVIRIS